MTEKVVGNFTDEYLQWRRLRRTVEASGGDPFGVFVELSRVIEGDLWRTLKKENGEHFSTFTEFVRDHSKGLGMDPKELKKILDVRGRTEVNGELTRNPGLFDDVRLKVTALLKDDVPPVAGHGEVGKGRSRDHAMNSNHAESPDGILARLKRDDPGMARQVIDGELTANAAARQKGWRKPRVLLTSPESVAKRIRDHFTNEEIAQLKELL